MLEALQRIKEIVFRALFKLGYRLGQLFAQAGSSFLIQGIDSGMRSKTQEMVNTEEVRTRIEEIMADELSKIVSQIAGELELNPEDAKEPEEEEIEEAINPALD